MSVDQRHLRIARGYQALIAAGEVMPFLCHCTCVRLFEIDKDDRVVYRCVYDRSSFYPSESQWRDMEKRINA